jgi:hypothetical protein
MDKEFVFVDGKSDAFLAEKIDAAIHRRKPRAGKSIQWLARKLGAVSWLGPRLIWKAFGRWVGPRGKPISFEAENHWVGYENWMGARKPGRVDGLAGASREMGFREPWMNDLVVKSHIFSLGTTGIGHSLIMGASGAGKSMVLGGMIRMLMEDGVATPLCNAANAPGWEIGVDEALDARHPAVALAWLSRARDAEISRVPALIERFAMSMARSMSGMGSFDDLHEDFAACCSGSRWARVNLPNILEKARGLAPMLCESRELALACAVAKAGARPRRTASL